MKNILKRVIDHIIYLRNENSIYSWYIIRKDRYRYLSKILYPKYSANMGDIQENTKIVICPYEGFLEGGGLADRLRGILSTFYICKLLNVQFRLVFSSPFLLKNYLVPNKYNWSDEANVLRYNIPKENVLILDTTQESAYQKRQQKKWLEKKIRERNGQIHVYTNASYSYDNGYHVLFHELFKPSEELQKSIDEQLAVLGNQYISISCRFLNLLGDFNETHGYADALTEDKKDELLNSVISQIKNLHQKHLNRKILCNSDSVTFLDKVKKLPYTYVIPGEVTHIDAKDSRGDYKRYEKTFLDFFMIAHASHIYILKTGRMHKSGYPIAASYVFEKPIDIIQF